MTSQRSDLYAVLGVAPQATRAEIDHAYRVLLRRYHPDTRGTVADESPAAADATLQLVLAAYAVLRDPAKRADYDRAARTRAQPPRLRRWQPVNPPARGEPSIVVGPVRWHRVGEPPSA